MKALILSAGFGTRLLPYTRFLPKPLFPVCGRPLIDHLIQQLVDHGATEIMINTHHLHKSVEAHVRGSFFRIPVHTRFEPVILDTGGAIKNLADFWEAEPFIVVNCDIKTDINLKDVYDFHLSHTCPVTLVMHDCERFNSVYVDREGYVKGFKKNMPDALEKPSNRLLAFTGIHVIDPSILEWIPEGKPAGIIDIYTNMIEHGENIAAHIAKDHYWIDIGTPENYKQAVFDEMAAQSFKTAFQVAVKSPVSRKPLKGDGSDRVWQRISQGGHSLILVDHGIRKDDNRNEADSFVAIGTHLEQTGVPVPQIISQDTFSGFVILEDLGDTHFETHIKQIVDLKEITACYKNMIDIIVDMNVNGIKAFQDEFTYQTSSYDKALILEKECRYFVDAFLNGYLGLDIPYDTFSDEFDDLSDRALSKGIVGFMHRDLQSRNIMVKNGRFFLIDFQGGRRGPLQYDVASLLIDPYVNLSSDLQKNLAFYAAQRTEAITHTSVDDFLYGYTYLKLTRGLQMLGAFGFLTKKKEKTWFKSHIPAAIETLHRNLSLTESALFPRLKKMVEQLMEKLYQGNLTH
ncbi:MAG: phosphotransferase [Proteobacteria bacterium]|nr:phosphotransferase [Pseudomonadota bacterium]